MAGWDRSFFSETAGTVPRPDAVQFVRFIFVFLPVTLAAFAAAVRLRSSSLAVLVLPVASYVFYGYGDHFAVLLLLRRSIDYDRYVEPLTASTRATRFAPTCLC